MALLRRAVPSKPPLLTVRDHAAGVLICSALAVVANGAAPIIGMPPLLVAIALGILVRVASAQLVLRQQAGIDFSAKYILRIAVALLGLKVVLQDVITLGWRAAFVITLSLLGTLAFGYVCARMLRQPRDCASIAATSVAICGASAALAASSVAPPRANLDRETSLVVIVVSLFSTAVMILYPLGAKSMGLGSLQTSLLLGGAIHDVAQVAGAGMSVSSDVGIWAMSLKLLRVACLLPVVVFWSAFHRRYSREAGEQSPPFPWFLIGFLALATLASARLVPQVVVEYGASLAGWMLAISVVALGLRTSISDLRTASPVLVTTICLQTCVQLALVLGLTVLLFGAR